MKLDLSFVLSRNSSRMTKSMVCREARIGNDTMLYLKHELAGNAEGLRAECCSYRATSVKMEGKKVDSGLGSECNGDAHQG